MPCFDRLEGFQGAQCRHASSMGSGGRKVHGCRPQGHCRPQGQTEEKYFFFRLSPDAVVRPCPGAGKDVSTV